MWSAAHFTGVLTSSWVDGKLYLGTMNGALGPGEIWAYDGSKWSKVPTTGIGANYYGLGVTARGSHLYAAGWDEAAGCRLFERGANGTWSAISNVNFNPPTGLAATPAATSNTKVMPAMFGGRMIATTGNAFGGEVWSAPVPSSYYFAEGTTRDNATDGSYEEWLCLQNANAAQANVDITYYTAGGQQIAQQVKVPAKSRKTVDVKLKLGADVDASCAVASDQPILVERPMYFNFKGTWTGGHNVIGCAGPMRAFSFAEGTTRAGFSTWVAVMNASDKQANVTIDYMLGDGTNKQVKVKVAAKQRCTREILGDVGPEQDVSIQVSADRNIVVERPMYFDYHNWATGGSDTLGINL